MALISSDSLSSNFSGSWVASWRKLRKSSWPGVPTPHLHHGKKQWQITPETSTSHGTKKIIWRSCSCWSTHLYQKTDALEYIIYTLLETCQFASSIYFRTSFEDLGTRFLKIMPPPCQNLKVRSCMSVAECHLLNDMLGKLEGCHVASSISPSSKELSISSAASKESKERISIPVASKTGGM